MRVSHALLAPARQHIITLAATLDLPDNPAAGGAGQAFPLPRGGAVMILLELTVVE